MTYIQTRTASVLACLPFLSVTNTHPKLPGACVHAAANHEAVTWLKHMEGTRHGGVRHGTHKDRHILRQAAEAKRETFKNFNNLHKTLLDDKT